MQSCFIMIILIYCMIKCKAIWEERNRRDKMLFSKPQRIKWESALCLHVYERVSVWMWRSYLPLFV